MKKKIFVESFIYFTMHLGRLDVSHLDVLFIKCMSPFSIFTIHLERFKVCKSYSLIYKNGFYVIIELPE